MSNTTAAGETIDVQALRVGMFVRLDGGWLAHPFPLSNFKISSAEQIATIRSLGVKRIRWDRSLSDVAPASPDATSPPAASAESPATPSPRLQVPERPDPVEPSTKPVARAPARNNAVAEFAQALGLSVDETLDDALSADPTEPLDERQLQARRLARQRASLARCERQFNEAAAAFKQATSLISSAPEQARAEVEQLSSKLLDKMLGEQDLCIRLLRDTAGGKASTHTLNVSIISMLLGRSFGLSELELQDLGVGAMLHDIGKIDLPERLHHPDDQFNPAELKAYQEHVALGLARGRKMGLSPNVMQVIAQHHEMADGSGFPLKVGSERMSDAARIVAMVNAYDTMCNPQLSARALTPHEALALMFTQGKKRFDTALLGTFIKLMGVYPAGSTVQLTDERFAVVVSVNSARPLKPRVMVHDPKVPRDEALVFDIGEHPGLGIRRGVKPDQLPTPTLHYLAPRQRVVYYFEPARIAEAA
jgi:putative nucleotidyltransferase with HDIG domain